ncbi:MAG: glycosyltransferase family 9 protein [Desulfobaccales bacterium]
MWHQLWLGAAKVYLKSRLRRRPPRPLAELDPARVGRVLLLNATGLGDLLFSTPAIRALKETYPHWRLDLLAHPRFADLVRHHPALERLWLYPGRGFRLIRLARELRRQRYGLALILHGNDPEATLLAGASGAPFIIGSAHSPLAFVYAAGVAKEDPYRHAIEHRLNFVRLLGAETATRHMEIFLPPGEEEGAAALLAQHFGPLADRLMAMHPTGSDPYKWWPKERFTEVGAHLWKRYQAPLLLVSGAADRQIADELAARLPGPTLVTGGRYSLLTTAALLKHARLFIGNDSGPLHMALALGVPALALIGADHPARIGPYQVPWGTYIYHPGICHQEPCLRRRCPDNRCLQAISVAEVLATVRDWWEPAWGRPDFVTKSI